MLHFCEYEIKQSGCRKNKYCTLNHSLETEHNINVLGLKDYQNVDLNLLKQVLQVKYKLKI